MDVYPLIFEPIFKPKIWGGRKLEALLGKHLPEDERIGESWEVTDLEDDQSVVASGPARGRTLLQLVHQWGTDLIGRASLFEGRFPLLIKFLDASETLSVQVHPDEAMARRLGDRVRIKNEAWYVIDAEEGGFIYRGVRKGVDADALKRAIQDQRVESVLNHISVRKGHCYYLPSGAIHALGAGVTVAEVQTPSDITYRVYDWNRIDPSTGRPRDLHLQEALQCISYDTTPIADQKREHIAGIWTSVTSLVRCESFVIERVRMAEGVEQQIPYDELVIWIVLEGRGRIVCDSPASPTAFGTGDTVVVPAGLKNARVQISDNCMWLEVTIPIPGSLTGHERPDRESLPEPDPTTERTGTEESDKPSTQLIDLAAIGSGDPSVLAAARLDRDVFPRLVTTMEKQPPAEAAETQPENVQTSHPAAGSTDDHTVDEQTAGADTTAATIKNLLREWKLGLRNGDLAACRAVFSTLVDTADMATVISMELQLVQLADRTEQSLRETFRRYFRERNYTGMLTIGGQICRLLPDRPVAEDFKRIRPYLLHRLEHASGSATAPTLRVIQ